MRTAYVNSSEFSRTRQDLSSPRTHSSRRGMEKAGLASSFLRPAVLYLLAILLGVSSVGRAQQPTPSNPAPAASAGSEQPAGTEALHLLTGRSLVVTSPVRITRVSLADPTVCDALVVSPTQLVLNAKKAGVTSLVIWGESGEVQTFDVTVDLDVMELVRKVRETFPDEKVKVEAQGNVVSLTGNVSTKDIGDRIVQLAQTMVPNKENVINLLQTPVPSAKTEVLLRVKFAELDRSALSQFGVNIMSLPGAKNVGSISTEQFSPPSFQGSVPPSSGTSGFMLGDLLNVFVFRPDINLAATIEALQTRNVLQILAEPNVMTETGKQASFLAGGEFPFPVPQAITGGAPVVTIQFKEFGIRLNFTPTVGADGLIHLEATPEVSALDFSNALRLNGFLVPALTTRRVQSVMDLKDGQSFAIAGLLDNRVTEAFSKIPGIGDIPILGKIFQSRSLNKSNTELLVLVTPHIVQPIEPGHEPAGPRFPRQFMAPVSVPKGTHSGQ